MSFESLGLDPALLSAVQKAGFTEPTAVQKAAIPRALPGADLIVSAQTGSGKTAAFMLPCLNAIAQNQTDSSRGVQTLVLTPTRELAQQIAQAAKQFSINLKGLRIATLVGGMPYGPQIRALNGRVDVLVATPGRLLDHINAGRVKLGSVQHLVLDEADRMLDMGFIQDIKAIVKRTPDSRQTLMFSATFEKNVAKLAQEMLKNPERIELASQHQKHANIQQLLLFADNAGHKFRILKHILENDGVFQAIVFSGTKRSADDLAKQLSHQGFKSGALHGDMNQRQRSRTLKQLQSGRLQVLVATDVAARGIDVDGITHAINFDLPMQAEDYVHRIGRTGRAGREGRAYTLATFAERSKIRRIERFTGQSLETEEIEGLEPIRQTTKPKSAGGARKPRSGQRKQSSRADYAEKRQARNSEQPSQRREFSDRSEDAPRKAAYAGKNGDAPRKHSGDNKRSSRNRQDEFFTRGEMKAQKPRAPRSGGNARPSTGRSGASARRLLQEVGRSVNQRRTATAGK